MTEITEQEYLDALKICRAYEAQKLDKKLSIYEGRTKNDVIRSEYKDYSGSQCYAFWVTKGVEIPDRNPEGIIKFSTDFFTLEKSHVPYMTYESAYKALLAGFKRKKFIK